MTEIVEFKLTLDESNCHIKASQILASHTNLSQAKIKDAMQKGAVWLHRGKGKQRLRRANKALKAGDELELNYNAEVLRQAIPEPKLIHDAYDYSIWFKPYGLNCQGSRWGDFASINRWVEVNLAKLSNTHERPVFLVHRLDRATTGLMVLCHSKKAAQCFSEMFSQGRVDKRYQAIVHGDFSIFPQDYEVNSPVEGKAACSMFSYVEGKGEYSLLDVRLLTGRKHQIRQHISSLGYPIVGDRLYGKSCDTEAEGVRDLQLQSVSLSFDCPFEHCKQSFKVAEQDHLCL